MTNRIQILFALQRLDEAVFCRVNNTRFSRRLFRTISGSADGPFYLLAAALSWLWLRDSSLQFLSLLTLSFVTERPLYFILKNGLKRNRPAQAIPGFVSIIVPSDHFSFPSGHTSGAFIFATTLMLTLPESTGVSIINLNLIAISAIYCWAMLVAASRVMLGVHFPGDTIAGAVLGTTTTFSIQILVLL
ncbi:MAG: phosphatase PAP2 family protein [Pseudohongiella sp.]|nr:phosphatase PAP2 family protein [Pseudohongiella sp.]MDO9520289.1 phosphatase PAP2 family protein [Pseudohongiella sp.]MDP2127098.1 phosphatase PAP2 family protein [Pseudohongiella sp.]